MTKSLESINNKDDESPDSIHLKEESVDQNESTSHNRSDIKLKSSKSESRIDSESSSIPRTGSSVSIASQKRLEERGKWRNRTEFILACLGNIVGFGNVWRFPYLVFQNGGGAFIIPYIIILLTVGFPMLLVETMIGQFTQTAPVEAFAYMAPIFKGLGYSAILIEAVYALYYNLVISWTFLYLKEVFTGQRWANCTNEYNTAYCVTKEEATNVSMSNKSIAAEEFFTYYVLQKTKSMEAVDWSQPNLTLTISLGVSMFIVICILSQGIHTAGKAVYFTATFPYFILFLLFLRGITLKGAMTGITYYLKPDVNKLLNPYVWRLALIQVIFGITAGVGVMVTYSSYNDFHSHLVGNIVIITVGDLFTSLFAGFVVFSFVGFVADLLKTDITNVAEAGYGLAFVVFLEGMMELPFSDFWIVCFFVMLFFLGIDTLFAYVESVTTFFSDSIRNIGRKPNKLLVAIFTGVLFFIAGVPTATKGGYFLLKLFDSFGTGIPVLFMGICICVLVGFAYGTNKFYQDLIFMTGFHPCYYCYIIFKLLILLIIPSLFGIILVRDLFARFMDTYKGDINGQHYPWYAFIMGWTMALLPVVCVPLGFLHHIWTSKEKTFCEKVKAGAKPTENFYKNAIEFGSYSDYEISMRNNQQK